MEIETTRFGRIEINEDKVITLTQGLLGFQEQRRFAFLPHREGSPFFWLQSMARADLAFVVINPFLVCSDYAFDLPDGVEKELKIEWREQVDTLVLVTIPSGNPRAMTVNLLGPLVINVKQRLGRQLILDPNRYPVRHPVIPQGDRVHGKTGEAISQGIAVP